MFAYCYHLVNVISYCLVQTAHVYAFYVMFSRKFKFEVNKLCILASLKIEVTLVTIIAASSLHKQIKVEFGLIICQF